MIRFDPNPFLGAVMRQVRSGRAVLSDDEPFYMRIESVASGHYVVIWFRTGGCSWDRVGGCTMCNYRAGTDVGVEGIIESVSNALANVHVHPNELLISPSGGMWDPKEVPSEALTPVYELARGVHPDRFFVETRAEDVNLERVREFRRAFGEDTALAVEMGLESSHDAVLAHCVNKGSSAQAFVDAAELLHDFGVSVYANVSLGTALLSRRSAALDALASARWALRNGADTVVLFPLHIKEFTLLDVLHKSGAYQRVELWDLVEILSALGPTDCARTEISWYKSHDYEGDTAVAPGSCDLCFDRVIEGLDVYRASQDHSGIQLLDSTRCECAGPRLLEDWALAPDDTAVAAGVLEGYRSLAVSLDLGESWRRHSKLLETSVTRGFTGYRDSLIDLVGAR